MSHLANQLFPSTLRSSSVLFYASSTLISAPVWMRPSSQPVRMFVVFWLLYCIVVNVAYQVSALCKPLCLIGHSHFLGTSGSLWSVSSSHFVWACICPSLLIRHLGFFFQKFVFTFQLWLERGQNGGHNMKVDIFPCPSRLQLVLSYL